MNAIHMRRFRNIPPLQYLLGFEAAARLESFSKAADELGLSASAISHEMRLLEERFGQPLFIRQGRAIRLTDAGRDYQRTVMQSLEQLEGGFRRLEPYRKPGSVVIYCESDFASRWLLPRLDDLKRAVPGCEPWVDTSGKAIDFESLEVSIAIVRGRLATSNAPTQDLFEDILVPVASPSLLSKALQKPEHLLKHRLIHDERPEAGMTGSRQLGWRMPMSQLDWISVTARWRSGQPKLATAWHCAREALSERVQGIPTFSRHAVASSILAMFGVLKPLKRNCQTM